ncbi:hypothetical protein BLNAU_11722 [Blattamonas nauphoetae]|uniref:Uncharacterized protein n=1 Tax=Blattamonas nauphoetae TaxID=2049346 RepID=A0ABQ9XQW3_9EUKA|nr:hypothetical protein BLNAU_11722 [Blattamonas nauphoetae]
MLTIDRSILALECSPDQNFVFTTHFSYARMGLFGWADEMATRFDRSGHIGKYRKGFEQIPLATTTECSSPHSLTPSAARLALSSTLPQLHRRLRRRD